jgi:error-prone DNA polymerase
LLPAAVLQRYRDGQLARSCGLVTVCHRPGTVNGVIFVTLEDETVYTNVFIWLTTGAQGALGASLLAVMVSGNSKAR